MVMTGGEAKQSKSEHSVKLPYLYKEGSKILQAYAEKKGSLKSLVYATRQERLYKRLLALVCRAVDNQPAVDAALASVGVLAAEPGLAASTARLLVAELLFGTGQLLASDARPVRTVLKYADQLRAATVGVEPAADRRAALPRYARVNTLLASVDDVIQQLTEEGWQRVNYPADVTYDDFIAQVKALSEGRFLLDLHVPCLLVFPPGTELHHHPLYLGGQLILQDKASCLPPVVLAPSPGDHVIDACSAPGMKTSQLAAMMKNKGTLIAVERDRTRFNTLSSMLNKAGVNNAQLVNGDFLSLKPAEHAKVTGILLDPSCSGTGMVSREPEEPPTEDRLRRLSNLQGMLLRHALSFPSVRRVVYSTCSITEEENEQVVADTLTAHPGWRLAVAAPATWRGRARTTLADGERCIRADPAEDLCHGFFVAAFERVEGVVGGTVDGARVQQQVQGKKGKKRKQKQGDGSAVKIETGGDDGGGEAAPGGAENGPAKKKAKHNQQKQGSNVALSSTGTAGAEKVNSANQGGSKKKKKNKKQKTQNGAAATEKPAGQDMAKANGTKDSTKGSTSESGVKSDATPTDGQKKKRKRSRSKTNQDKSDNAVPVKRMKSEEAGSEVKGKKKVSREKKSKRMSKKRRNRLKHAAVAAVPTSS